MLTTHQGNPRYVIEASFGGDDVVCAAPFEALTWQLEVLWLR